MLLEELDEELERLLWLVRLRLDEELVDAATALLELERLVTPRLEDEELLDDDDNDDRLVEEMLLRLDWLVDEVLLRELWLVLLVLDSED